MFTNYKQNMHCISIVQELRRSYEDKKKSSAVETHFI